MSTPINHDKILQSSLSELISIQIPKSPQFDKIFTISGSPLPNSDDYTKLLLFHLFTGLQATLSAVDIMFKSDSRFKDILDGCFDQIIDRTEASTSINVNELNALFKEYERNPQIPDEYYLKISTKSEISLKESLGYSLSINGVANCYHHAFSLVWNDSNSYVEPLLKPILGFSILLFKKIHPEFVANALLYSKWLFIQIINHLGSDVPI